MSNTKMMKIDKNNLKEGMEIAADIYDMRGNVLIAQFTKLKTFHLQKISTLTNTKYVYILAPGTAEDMFNATLSNEAELCGKAEKLGYKSMPVDQVRTSVFKKVKENLDLFSENASTNFEILFQVVEQIIESILSYEDLVYEMNRIQSADAYLYNHCINTAILSILIGISSGMKSEELYSLGKGAFFADIGKLQIDPFILMKPTELTPEEYEIVKKYPEYGYSFMKNFPEMDERALDCILHSRERIDGKGYPHGLKKDQISLPAKIVGLASYFDALCSDRPYRNSLSPYKAMSKLFGEVDDCFDAELLKRAIKILGYYDVGMYVELQSNDLAKVIRSARYKPLLRIIQVSVMNDPAHVYEIDMAKNPSVKIKDVLVKSEYERLIGFI